MSVWPQFDSRTRRAVQELLRSGKVNYWTGTEGRQFEDSFAAWLGVRNAVVVLNGAAARRVALLALGLDPTTGDGALVVRHRHGEVADITAAQREAKRRKLPLVEDCTECLGGTWRGRKVGSLGIVSFFAFDVDAAFTCGGDGGMVCTDDDALAWELRSIRDHGYDARAKLDLLNREGRTLYVHRRLGYNLRLTEMQSLIGSCELRRYDDWNLPRRRRNALAMLSALSGHPCVHAFPHDSATRRNAFPCLALELALTPADTAALVADMVAKGVPARLIAPTTVALPTFPTLTAADLRHCISAFSAAASAFVP